MIGRMLFWGVILCIAVWVAWMATDNEHPYVYDPINSHMVPDPAPQEGGSETVIWSLAKVNKICPGTVQRMFRDIATGQIVSTLDTTPVSRSVHNNDSTLPRTFMLPPNLPPLTGYSALICSECNLFQQFIKPLCYMTPEITFRVRQ